MTADAASPALRAAADAASLLAAFGPPPGAVRAARLAVSSLTQAPDVPASPDVVMRTEWYQVPGRPQVVYAWVLAHPPEGLAQAGSGAASRWPCSGGDCVTTRDVEFSRPVVPGVLTQRWLEVTVAGDGAAGTAIRVDAVVVWVPARPSSERIPASARVVTITLVRGFGAVTGPRPVTITNPATVARIAGVVDRLPVFPPGRYSCPADQGQGMRLTFRAAAGDPVLAAVQGDTTGCGTVSVTINGHQMLTLGSAAAMQRQVLAIAGLHWPAPLQ